MDRIQTAVIHLFAVVLLLHHGINIASACEDEEFTCDDGICVPVSWVCDGANDCSGGEDEADCSSSCTADEFTCDTGLCIAVSWQCDYFNDCDDGEDEAGCPCNPDDYDCDDGACIPASWLCDSWDDCATGEDELGCNGEGGDEGDADEDGGANAMKAAGFGLSVFVVLVTMVIA